jgi:cytochrome b6-f complex iron-sulfur subunit
MDSKSVKDSQVDPMNYKGISRRRLLSWIGWGSSAAFLIGSAAAMVKFFYPKVLYEPDLQFPVGFPEDFPLGKMTFFSDRNVFIVKEAEGFHAISAVCTHLGCLITWDDKLEIFPCRCHGTRFDRDGNNFAGPAPRPLDSFALSLDDTGQLVVDKSDILARSNGRMGEFESYFRVDVTEALNRLSRRV